MQVLRYFLTLCGVGILFTVVNSVPAFALDCPAKMPKIVVKKTIAKTEKIERISSGGLSRLHGGQYRPGDPSVLGLGGGHFELEIDVDFQTKQSGTLQCVGVGQLTGTFHIYPAILIAQNYRKDSCEYKAIFEHEMEHVQILKRFQSVYAGHFTNFLRSIGAHYAQSKVTANVNASFIQKQLEDDIAAKTQAFIEKIGPALQERQLALDSPQEYARIHAKCSNWAQ